MKISFWTILFSLSTITVFFCVVNPEVLAGISQTPKLSDASNLNDPNSSHLIINENLTAEYKALPASLYYVEENAADLRIILKIKHSEGVDHTNGIEKPHDKQFVKSGSALCPGAYEHAL